MPAFVKVRAVLNETPRWLIGAAVATPVLGIMQGVSLILDYRKYYCDVPYPVSPSHGLVVSVDERNQETKKYSIAHLLSFQKNNPPLRLLVIGDSLAAGVGVIHRATPVLPESIARTLSQKFGGRPVYWTCIGRPGAVLQEIIHHIKTDESILSNLSTTLEPPALPPTWKGRLLHRIHCIDQWWTRNRRKGQKHSSPPGSSDEVDETRIDNPVKSRWSVFLDDIRSFVKACRGQVEPEEDIDDDSYYEESEKDRVGIIGDLESDEQSLLWKLWKKRLNRWAALREENTSTVGDYDIAVVLTGANDLKHAWLPFMFKENGAEDGLTVQEKLQTVVEALRLRMKPMLDRSNPDRISSSTSQGDNKDDTTDGSSNQDQKSSENEILAAQKPVVVFPATPITLVPQLQSVPIRWFIVAVFKRLENKKKELAEKFPGGIVFVDSPPVTFLSEIEAGEGKMYEDLKAEAVLLKLTNVTRRVQENFEKKIKEYRDKWAQLVLDQGEQSGQGNDHDSYSRYNHPDESYPDYETSKTNKLSRILSLDQIHPSDEGYELWGRHIASEILKQWKPPT
ncbi:hypothetical protein ACA910_021127 [Epithemia clementina (nom. ined.)]